MLNRINGGERPLAQSGKRFVGTSSVLELMVPPGNHKLEIFADTETFYETRGVKPWEWIGKKHVAAALSQMVVRPILLAWQYKNLGGETNCGEWVKDCRVIRNGSLEEIHYFLGNLGWIYNELKLTPVLYFHNSSYDIPVLACLFKALDPDLILYFYVVKESKKFIRGCMQSPKYKFFCEFGDTLKYDRDMSIESAGKILNLEKIEGFPYGMCDAYVENGKVFYTDLHTGEKGEYPLDKAMEYAERDVDIMRLYHQRVKKTCELLNREMVVGWANMRKTKFLRKTQTRPNHSKQICNKHLNLQGWPEVDCTFRFDLVHEYENMDNVRDMYRRTIESNCGGFTSFNKHISRYDCGDDRKIVYYDVNSMYPWILTQEIPFGTILTEPPPETNNYTSWYCVKITECKWKGGMECIKNEAFSIEKRSGIPFFVEGEYWKFVLENCDIEYEVEHVYYQRNTSVLRDLINKYFDRRHAVKDRMKDLDKNSNEYADLHDTQNGLKLLMNSLYGKMCEKGHHTNTVFNELKYETYVNEKKVYPCILTGSFITYRARLTLLRKIRECLDAGYEFLYADTDSVMVGCPKNEDPERIFGVDNGLIGEWKLEGTFDLYLSIWKKKKYFLANRSKKEYKMALSGIPKRVHKLIERKLKEDYDQTVEDMAILFNPNENIIVRNVKSIAILNERDQQIIWNADFAMNSTFKEPTGYMTIEDDDYTIERCID